ncbi:MAG: HNH endonuclease signature motif containing protein [Cypionkella sp.]|uniref:HNH endonuclease n=1 Tax=Cypionkella sp. TaxID=2811411 RepID=UPI0027233E5A|nr:HNH endonuclease signature motif containing protein [Cypionkella sp.]MDO8327189.1 HNH endonuclease signature motif containing protein [Cypionkella sp.]
MALRDYARHSAKVTKTQRWKALRLKALERDGWRCVQCGERRWLEVDHVKPVRDRPDLSFDLANLQCLCGRCHARKTRIEIGLGRPNPAREAWKKLVRDLDRNPETEKTKCLIQ